MSDVGLTRDQILGSADTKIQAVFVPEWNGTVYIRNLNGKGRDAFEGSRVRIQANNKVELLHDNTRATLLSLSICDEAGTLVFSESDVIALGQKNASALDRLFEVAQELSALRPKDLEAKVKNFGAVQADSSGSCSQ